MAEFPNRVDQNRGLPRIDADEFDAEHAEYDDTNDVAPDLAALTLSRRDFDDADDNTDYPSVLDTDYPSAPDSRTTATASTANHTVGRSQLVPEANGSSPSGEDGYISILYSLTLSLTAQMYKYTAQFLREVLRNNEFRRELMRSEVECQQLKLVANAIPGFKELSQRQRRKITAPYAHVPEIVTKVCNDYNVHRSCPPVPSCMCMLDLLLVWST